MSNHRLIKIILLIYLHTFLFLDIEYFISQKVGKDVQNGAKSVDSNSSEQGHKQQTPVVMTPSEYHGLCLKLQGANERAESAETELQRALHDLQKMR